MYGSVVLLVAAAGWYCRWLLSFKCYWLIFPLYDHVPRFVSTTYLDLFLFLFFMSNTFLLCHPISWLLSIYDSKFKWKKKKIKNKYQFVAMMMLMLIVLLPMIMMMNNDFADRNDSDDVYFAMYNCTYHTICYLPYKCNIFFENFFAPAIFTRANKNFNKLFERYQY